MFSLVSDALKNRYAVATQFYVNLRTTVATTRLGTLWWVLDPLLLMVIYYFVVKVVFGRGGPDYHFFALSGIVTWQSFSRSVNLATKSLTRNSSLIKQVSLPMPLYVVLSPIVQSFFYLIGLLIIVVWNHSVVGVQTFGLVVPVVLVALLASGLGMFLSIFEVFLRDTGKIVTYILRFGFYLSPILYSPNRIYKMDSIPEYAKILYSLNPMVHIITSVRDILVDGVWFDFKILSYLFLIEIVLLQVGLIFFRRMAPLIPKRL